MDDFYEITRDYEVTLCKRHRQVDFCVAKYEYFDNHSEFKKGSVSPLAVLQ